MIQAFHQRFLFTAASKVLSVGKKRPLTPADFPPLPQSFNPDHISDKFHHIRTDRLVPFLWNIFRVTGAISKRLVVFNLLYLASVLVSPLLLSHLLHLLPHAARHQAEVLVTATALGLVGMVGAIFLQQYYYNATNCYAAIVSGINQRIVVQALRLQRSARSVMNTGDLVNHLSSDTEAIAEAAFFVPDMIGMIIRTLIGITLLWMFLGAATLAAVGVLLSPLSVMVARRYRALDHQLMEYRDQRVTLMSQILQGIRVVKYQAWERSLRNDVSDIRDREIRTRVRIVATDAVSTALFVSVTTLVAFAGFATFVAMDGELTAPTVFACIALFALLEEPFGMISHLLANIQHANVATQRLHHFFTAPVRANDERKHSAPCQPVGVSLRNLTIQFPDSPALALESVSLEIPRGTSVAIVGAVGSGKSTLLRCIAGLHITQSGGITFNDVSGDQRPRIAYVPQESFTLNATIIDNITFGTEESLLTTEVQSIVYDCALAPDLRQMQNGLHTEIGERGINLSGGQRQRISLARAAYAQPGIVLLDDPLSAVDVETEDHLVKHLLFGRWKNITRVVVTHRLTHLDKFDKVVVLEGGRVIASGAYHQVQHAIPSAAFESVPLHSFATGEPVPAEAMLHSAVPHAVPADGSVEERERFTQDEDRVTGGVRGATFAAYARSVLGNHPVFAPLLAIALIATAAGITVLPMAQSWWMAYWTNGSAPNVSALLAVGIFGLLGLVVLVGWAAERLLWLWRAAEAGRTLHNRALQGVLYAPLRFFDTTPSGRILNRFARDQEAVDDHLSWNFEQSFKSLAQTLGSLILIMAIVPVIVVVTIPVLAVYYILQRDYRTSAREAKRLESIARSPRYSHFKELVTGLDVIHGYGRENWFMQGFHRALLEYQKAYYCSILLNRWFSVRVPLVSGCVGLATCIAIVMLAETNTIAAGTAGLVLTYALSFWGNLNWTVRAFSEVESRMTSVERLEYYGSLEPEPNISGEPMLDPAAPWPTHGAIVFSNVSVRYAPDLPRVLNNITFSIPAKAKVGVIGRTGSGKSTLFQTIFRFLEPESGSIVIDSVNVQNIPLERLRNALAIIPQDPTLFMGSIRSNVDRYSRHTDQEIWLALQRVQLDHFIRSLPNGLHSLVTEGGSNFSQGQRQLLCLARAILADSRIIVLDEATASVDSVTDAHVQTTIRKEFAHATVLTIAHRLETVADYDIIIELDAGRVKSIRHRFSE